MTRLAIAAFLVAACAGGAAFAAGDAPTKKKGGQSIEARHQVCLNWIRKHDRSCDPWIEPTCGADTGFYRPEECVKPRGWTPK